MIQPRCSGGADANKDMQHMIPPFPLAWPPGRPRTKVKATSTFRTGLETAIKNVRNSMRLFSDDCGVNMTDIVITSNATLFDHKPTEAGVAVWFIWDGLQRCIAVDKYVSVAANLQAMHHILEARRVEMRHAGIEMVRTTFRGFTLALPAPDIQHDWWLVLGVDRDCTLEVAVAAYRKLVRENHGNSSVLSKLNVARDLMKRELATDEPA